MKKLYSTFIVLCVCTNIFAQHDFQAANTLNGIGSKTIYYRVTSTEPATVAVSFRGETPTAYREYTTYIVIPAIVTSPATATPPSTNYLVTSIDANAFYDCTGLDSVLLPSSITFIDSLAFGGCTTLKKCVMPSDINFVGEKAFYNCRMLEEIELPSNITKISDGTFRDCYNLKAVNFPDMVTSIGDFAFSNCTSLETITLSKYIKRVSAFSFLGCFVLNSINVDADNTKYMSDNGVLYTHSQDTLLIYPSKKSGMEFTPNNNLKYVSDYSFMYSLFLKKINFNNSLKKIGNTAFYNCTGLSVLNISDSLSYIGEGAFYNCKNLDTIKITAENPPCFQQFTLYNVPENVNVMVQCKFLENYQNSEWGEYFTNIKGYDCPPTGIDNPADECWQKENIFPNPVQNDLFVNVDDEKVKRVEVYSLSGDLVVSENNTNKVSMSNIPQGIYIVKIKTNNKSIVRQIIKN